jgi:hypothetical protein
MARTPENENATRDRQYTTGWQADTAYNKATEDVNQFNRNENTLQRGGNVGANPYKSADYLANVNKQEADSLNGATNAGKTALLDANRKGGGGNSGATTGAISGLALQRARLADKLSTDRTTENYGKNLDWQRFLASAPLQGAHAETGLLGPTIGANASLNKDLTGYGMQQQAEWYKQLSQLEQLAKTAASAGTSAATGGAGVGGFGEG